MAIGRSGVVRRKAKSGWRAHKAKCLGQGMTMTACKASWAGKHSAGKPRPNRAKRK